MFNSYNGLTSLQPSELIMYLRKSRADDPQLTVDEVLENHENEIDVWVANNLSFSIPEENRYREVVSGESLSERVEFQKVLKLAESPSVKAIVVKEITRLGRPDTMEIGLISKTLRYTNTMIISVSPFRVLNPADKFEREMLENELKQGNNYLEYVKGILRDGRDNSAKVGNYQGSRPPYGYDKITITENKKKCPTLVINEEKANVVRMIFNWYVNENIGTQVISNRLNELNIAPPRGKVWRPDGIRTILENVHYIGKVTWNKRKAVHIVENGEFRKTRKVNTGDDFILKEGRHEAIISEELFYAAQEKRGRTHRACANKELKNPFASILYCSCGKAMSHRLRKYPSGEDRGEARLVCNDQVHCGSGSCRLSEMETFITNRLREKISDFEIEIQNVDTDSIKLHDKLITKLETKLSEIDARELSMWETQIDPNVDNRMPQHIFQNLLAKLTTEREETKEALEFARKNRPAPIDYEKKLVTLKLALDALTDDSMSAADKNQLLKDCIDRIVYHREKPAKVTGKGVGKQWTEPPIDIEIYLTV